MNDWNYSKFRTDADRQHSGLFAHIGYRAGHEILRAHGYDYSKNKPKFYREHCLEAYLATSAQQEMDLSPPG